MALISRIALMRWAWAAACALATQAAWPQSAGAQSSSLHGSPDGRPPLTLPNNSWLYLAVPTPRELQMNDLVTVLVTESSQVLSEGNINRRTQSNIDANLQNWVKLNHFGLTADNETEGDPRVRGTLNSQLRTTSQLETQDSVKFKITARIVDIRPNGTLVIEAHKSLRNNNEIWEQSLSGIIRKEDVLPNNTVMSEDIYELMIFKREQGQIRDSYRRGWLLKSVDRFKPF
ncbi:MAG TPA: flagellar basal body L-ring protein FlgH [Pirellulales bacterium]|nr:flagellar basal body L-ring protein FlgH [Pirellulales bacterium]